MQFSNATISLRFFASTLFLAATATCSTAADKVDFANDVKPIFEEHCIHCHGEDEQESGLRLDRRGIMLLGGDLGQPAIVPGKPEKSFLLDAVKHRDPQAKMPPDEEKLSPKKIATLEAWIKQGANWPGQMKDVARISSEHWSFQAVERPSIPKGELNPVDAFLLSRLKSKGLTFSKPTDPRSLVRRATIVLTGLAPTPKETDDFLAAFKKEPEQAYRQLIDQLLNSPHFGERWAQHWLDVIRWAETNGSESNLYRKNAWMYRDYVIRSFNEDKPYNQFVREQIAGDSLGSGEAMGFLVAGPHVPAATVGREETAIRQARADRMDEIVQTVGASLMAITVGCARCHNHKFDPVTITDYYAMSAVFQDIEFGSRFPEFKASHPRRQAAEKIMKDIASQRNVLRRSGGWEEQWGAYREFHFNQREVKSIRVSFKTGYVGIDEFEIFGPDEPTKNLALKTNGTKVSSSTEFLQDGRNHFSRVNDGEYGTMAWRARTPKGSKERPWLQFDFAEPVKINQFRISSNREYYYETDYLTRMPQQAFKDFNVDIPQEDGSWKTFASTFGAKQKNESVPDRKTAINEIQRLIDDFAERGPQTTFAGRLINPVKTFVFHRGSPENPKAEVFPSGPTVLGGQLGLDSNANGADRRAKFAAWITNSKHPLTARVMVNRIWHHLFGTGIVSTPADFGTAGAAPSHPELLDWMASEFVAPKNKSMKPWSMKSLIRLIVMSKAFRQSSQPSTDGLSKDATSSLLWRYPPRRVDAEVIRDSILLASGSLNQKIGGLGYRIHNVKKTYAQWEVVNNHGPHTWRRMIYQERMRRVDDKMFTAFDFPDCGQIRARRPVSTTPLQALNLMNSPFVVEQSSLVATRAQKNSQSTEEQVKKCFELLLSRPPSDSELELCSKAADEVGLPIVCRSLINSNEFAFIR